MKRMEIKSQQIPLNGSELEPPSRPQMQPHQQQAAVSPNFAELNLMLANQLPLPQQTVPASMPPNAAQQFRFITSKVQQLISSTDDDQFKILNNLASMEFTQLVILQAFYSYMFNVELWIDLHKMNNKYLHSICYQLLIERTLFTKLRILQSLRTENLQMLANSLFSVPEPIVIQALQLLQADTNGQLMEYMAKRFEAHTIGQQLIFYHLLFLLNIRQREEITEEEMAKKLIISIKEGRMDHFVFCLAQIPRQCYLSISLKVEALSGASLFDIIRYTFQANLLDMYTVLVYSEYKIEINMGIALIINEMVKQQSTQELVQVAIQSRARNIQHSYQKYGNLYSMFQQDPVLLALWQVRHV